MKRATIPFLAAMLLLGLLAAPVHAKSAAELLREGLYAEEVEGNLDAAIGIYQQIVLDTTAPKNLVAQALYRQGMYRTVCAPVGLISLSKRCAKSRKSVTPAQWSARSSCSTTAFQ